MLVYQVSNVVLSRQSVLSFIRRAPKLTVRNKGGRKWEILTRNNEDFMGYSREYNNYGIYVYNIYTICTLLYDIYIYYLNIQLYYIYISYSYLM